MNKFERKAYFRPFMQVESFSPQEYIAVCTWRATLHCGVYGNSDYLQGRQYIYGGLAHGEACQNTVVTVRKDKDGNVTITGQEVPKGSPVTYVTEPTIRWGEMGVGAPSAPQSSEEGAIYSWAQWNSKDIVHDTGDYLHVGYVASWEEYPEGSNSNVS